MEKIFFVCADWRALLAKEIKRKLFHSLSLLYAAGFYFLGREGILWILVPLLAIEGTLEIARLCIPRFNEWILALFGGINREKEMNRMSGIFWMLLGASITIAVFKDQKIVLCALGYLTFSDAAASLVGLPLGRHKFLGKSLEGSLACFVASFLVGLAFINPLWALASAFLVTAVELLPLPLNDNFWIPILSGCFLNLIRITLGTYIPLIEHRLFLN